MKKKKLVLFEGKNETSHDEVSLSVNQRGEGGKVDGAAVVLS